MAQRVSGGIAAILIIAALAVGGILGYLLPRGHDHDTSTAGRIDYACVVAADMQEDGRSLEERIESDSEAAIRDIMTVSSLLGGSSLRVRDEATEEQLMGHDLFAQMSRFDLEGLETTFDDVIDYCESR